MMTFLITPELEVQFGIAFVMWIGATGCLVSLLVCISLCFLDLKAQVQMQLHGIAAAAAKPLGDSDAIDSVPDLFGRRARERERVPPPDLHRVLKCDVLVSFNNATFLPLRVWSLLFANAAFVAAVFGFVTLSRCANNVSASERHAYTKESAAVRSSMSRFRTARSRPTVSWGYCC